MRYCCALLNRGQRAGGGLQAGSLFVHVQLEIEANAALAENLGNAFEKPIDLLWQRVQTPVLG